MDYKVVKSNRKTMSLSISDDLIPVVRVPYFVSDTVIDNFVSDNRNWIESAVDKKKRYLQKFNLTEDEIKLLTEKAKEIVLKKVEYFSSIMNLHPTGVKITKAKKRFGSCNAKNSLCFSCFLMNYPEKAIDYVVVHELSHIKHHNHSRDFYQLVEQYIPDYKECEKLLKL